MCGYRKKNRLDAQDIVFIRTIMRPQKNNPYNPSLSNLIYRSIAKKTNFTIEIISV